jgi:uroporphyrinogen-III decarboxylase
VALPRLKSLIAPAKEHNLLTGISMPSVPAGVLPAIQEAGFNLAHVFDPEQSDLLALRDHWCGRMVLAGGIPDRLLVAGQPEQVEEQVDKSFAPLVKGGSFVVSSLDGIHAGVRPENFMAFVRAIHRLG